MSFTSLRVCSPTWQLMRIQEEEPIGLSHLHESQGGYPCLRTAYVGRDCLAMEGCGADYLGLAQE